MINYIRIFPILLFSFICSLIYAQEALIWTLSDTIAFEKEVVLDSMASNVSRWGDDTTAYRKDQRTDIANSLIEFSIDATPELSVKAETLANRIRYLNGEYRIIMHDFEEEILSYTAFKSIYPWYEWAVLGVYGREKYVQRIDSFADLLPKGDQLVFTLSSLGRALYYREKKIEASAYFEKVIEVAADTELRDTLDVGRARSFLRQIQSLRIGHEMIAFSTRDIEGNEVKVDKGDQKVTLIDFWATWCPPCVRDMPLMQRIYDTYGDRNDFRMIGVSIDETFVDLQKYLEKHQIHWTQIFEKRSDGTIQDGDLVQLYNGYALPTYYIIDRNGIIRYNFDSLRAGEDLEEVLARVMKE